MTCSVAMCTYNGTKYLQEQLYSIIHQSHLVDEIVICDDGSIDDVSSIVSQVSSATDIPIYFFRNEENLGLVRNFAKAISYCKCDVIFLSDQDDIWKPNKVETILSAFETDHDVELVSSDADLIDENGCLIGDTLWQTVHLDMYKEYEKCGLLPEFCAVTGRVTGATIAFKNIAPYNDFLKYQGNFYYHDETLSFIAISSGHYLPIEEKLISYRIYPTQTCGLDQVAFDRDIHVPFDYSSNFKSLPLNPIWKRRLDFIEDRIEYKRKFWRIITNWSKYNELYGQYASRFRQSDIRRSFSGILHKLHLTSHAWDGNPYSVCRDFSY